MTRSSNLRDLLVTAKIPSNSVNPQLAFGSFRCGRNCATCPYISHGLTTYTFFSTEETRPIKINLTCETRSKPTTAAEQFLSSPNHTADDMLLSPIEKIFCNRDSIRKAREGFFFNSKRQKS